MPCHLGEWNSRQKFILKFFFQLAVCMVQYLRSFTGSLTIKNGLVPLAQARLFAPEPVRIGLNDVHLDAACPELVIAPCRTATLRKIAELCIGDTLKCLLHRLILQLFQYHWLTKIATEAYPPSQCCKTLHSLGCPIPMFLSLRGARSHPKLLAGNFVTVRCKRHHTLRIENTDQNAVRRV
jgi:hypothetical protein